MIPRGRVHLSGAGSRPDQSALYGEFFEEATSRSEGAQPRIVVLLWAERQQDGAQWHGSYVDLFKRLGDCTVDIVQLAADRALEPSDIALADGLVVGGGPTPGYHRAIVPLAAEINRLIVTGVPYCGISAGAMIAGIRSLVGGWLVDGIAVSPEETAEGIEELSIRPGLGIVDEPIDTHVAQYGHLGRLVSMVESGRVTRAIGIDEDTALIVESPQMTAVGHGRVWIVEQGESPGSVRVQLLEPNKR